MYLKKCAKLKLNSLYFIIKKYATDTSRFSNFIFQKKDSTLKEIVDIKRFATPWKLVSYAGLSPSTRESSGKTKTGRITK